MKIYSNFFILLILSYFVIFNLHFKFYTIYYTFNKLLVYFEIFIPYVLENYFFLEENITKYNSNYFQ